MVQAAPEVRTAAPDTSEVPAISPTRGGGHAGHALGFFLAAQIAPVVSALLALSMLAGGMGATGWMWAMVAVIALPALGLFAFFVFIAEQGLE